MPSSFIGPIPAVPLNTSMTTSVNGIPINAQQMSGLGFDISWTGAPVGTFGVEVSNTYTQSGQGVVENPGSWNSIVLSTVPAATGTSGSAFINVAEIQGLWLRLTYTATSGTGTLNATVCGKQP